MSENNAITTVEQADAASQKKYDKAIEQLKKATDSNAELQNVVKVLTGEAAISEEKFNALFKENAALLARVSDEQKKNDQLVQRVEDLEEINTELTRQIEQLPVAETTVQNSFSYGGKEYIFNFPAVNDRKFGHISPVDVIANVDMQQHLIKIGSGFISAK